MTTGLAEKVAYLQGLASGLGVAGNNKDGQITSGVLDVLSEMAREIQAISHRQEEMAQYLEAIDLDLGDLEDAVYDQEESLDLVEAECPHCGETVYFEEDVLSEAEPVEVACPKCGIVVFPVASEHHGEHHGAITSPQDQPDGV